MDIILRHSLVLFVLMFFIADVITLKNPSYRWVKSQDRTKCSVTCGPGIQKSVTYCVDAAGTHVSEILCTSPKPVVEYTLCNKHACTTETKLPPSKWEPDTWQNCSLKNDSWTQVRRIQCIQNGRIVDDHLCDGMPKPNVTRPCISPSGRTSKSSDKKKIKIFSWIVSQNKSDCSKSCGTGFQTLVIYCADANGTRINETLCNATKPLSKTFKCNERQCEEKIPLSPSRWEIDKWQNCSKTNGSWRQVRRIKCFQNRMIVNDELCNITKKPDTTRPCSAPFQQINQTSNRIETEAYSWTESQNRTECSKKCGSGNQTSIIYCADVHGNLVNETLCNATKPRPQYFNCNMGACEEVIPHFTGKWVADDWKICSEFSGAWVQMRAALCLRNTTIVDDNLCDMKDKPRMIRFCNATAANLNQNAGDRQIDASKGQNKYRVNIYTWVKSENKTECSQSCGLGIQKSVLHCVNASGHRVDNSLCKAVLRPISQFFICKIQECVNEVSISNARWEVEEWQKDSVTCTQSRKVQCYMNNSPVNENYCSIKHKPKTERSYKPSDSHRKLKMTWITSPWSPCSVTCGVGKQRRQVQCVSAFNYTIIFPSSRCRRANNSKSIDPAQLRECHGPTCKARWIVSPWSRQCVLKDGVVIQYRKVSCSLENLDQCNDAEKPPSYRSCPSIYRYQVKLISLQRDQSHNISYNPAHYSWFVSSWSQCSVSCGKGRQSRKVTCIYSVQDQPKSIVHGIDASLMCGKNKGNGRMATIRTCKAPPCHQSRWYIGSWSSCSVTCGQGLKRRTVVCLNSDKRPDDKCDKNRRPKAGKKCKRPHCKSSNKYAYAVIKENPLCKDSSYSYCKAVKKARMCTYKSFSKKCCVTCAKASL